MAWKPGMLAGIVLLTGCDTRTEPQVTLEMRGHIRERCNQGLYSLPEGISGGLQLNYCGCLVDRLTDGKSRSDIIEMEENPALYMEPGDDVIRQCTDHAREQERRSRESYEKGSAGQS